MKLMKKMMALVIAMVMVLAMALPALAAVTISIDRDTTYDSEASGDRDYSYRQIFRANYTSHKATGGNYEEDGAVPGDIYDDPDKGVSYFLTVADDSARINKLGSWDATAKAWTKSEGNKWFKLTPSADGKQYTVAWDNTNTNAETVQAAAAWLSKEANYPAIAKAKMDLSADKKKWTASVDPGYYVIEGSEGKNLVAATTDIEITEKNSYPTIDKKQADEDFKVASPGNYTDDLVKVAIEDEIEYSVVVHVTADANRPLVVTDTMTKGLKYDSTAGLTFDPALTENTDYVVVDANYEITVDGTAVKPYVEGAAWQIAILPTANTLGKDIKITFKAKVTSDALTDTERDNTVELKYDNQHYVTTDKVEYTTYFTGIEKVDGTDTNIKLEGVEFTLKEKMGENAPVEYKVTKHADGYYYPDATNGSATIVTDKDGLIKIRGLDDDKKYTLTETKPLDGYNPMDGDVELELTEDKGNAYSQAVTNKSWGEVKNNKGSLLPSTGGIGTTIFYIIGSILVIGAGVLLVVKKRMSAE